jgi:Tol biopolymer transport system component
MRRILILVLGIAVQLYSQNIFEVKSVKILMVPSGNETAYMAPRWAPVGNKIAFSSGNYKGIWLYDFDTRQVRQITDELSAGFGFSWSEDGQSILARVSRYQNQKRQSAVKIFNIAKNTEKYLTDYRTFLPDIPRWTPGDEQVYFFDGKQETFINVGVSTENQVPGKILYSRNDHIILKDNLSGEQSELQPFEGQQYLNLTLSPDNRHIAFEVYGGDCYIMDTRTQVLVDLGRGNYPRWSPDGEYIAYMMAQDNGYTYTASDIYVSNLDGSIRQNLTANLDNIAMYPSWSPSADRLAYSTYDQGTIEYLELVK